MPLTDRAGTAAAITADGEVDVVLDALGATGSSEPTLAGYDALRPGGSMVLVGGVREDLALPYGDLMRRRLTLRGSWMFTHGTLLRVWNSVRGGALDLSAIEVRTVGLDDPSAALALAAGTGGDGFVVLVPWAPVGFGRRRLRRVDPHGCRGNREGPLGGTATGRQRRLDPHGCRRNREGPLGGTATGRQRRLDPHGCRGNREGPLGGTATGRQRRLDPHGCRRNREGPLGGTATGRQRRLDPHGCRRNREGPLGGPGARGRRGAIKGRAERDEQREVDDDPCPVDDDGERQRDAAQHPGPVVGVAGLAAVVDGCLTHAGIDPDGPGASGAADGAMALGRLSEPHQ